MNLKKNIEINIGLIKEIVVSLLMLAATGLLTAVIAYKLNGSTAEIIRDTVSAAFGGLITLFLWYKNLFSQTLEYDNENHPVRFWGVYLVCYLVSMGMLFLPAGGWCFLSIMVLLSMFSNAFIGLTAGSVLLMLTVSLAPDGNTHIFCLYFLLGLVGISLFARLDLDFRVGEPLFLSALSSLVLQTAYLVIFENQPLSLEIFLFPILNVFINLVLLFLILKYFSSLGMYHIQDRYEEINDPEFPLLAELKVKNKEHYFEAVHRSYLGDRIAKRLHINDKAVKGCSYYYKLAMEAKKDDRLQQLQEGCDFPEELSRLMEECMKGSYGSKEACVVLTSDKIYGEIKKAQKEDRDVPYDKIISDIFDDMVDGECLLNSDLTIRELRIMEKVFMEEKLYYDFLR